MDKVAVLCAKDSDMMNEFSRRSFSRITNRSLLPAFFSVYQDANVKKEIDKDRLIIEEAAHFFETCKPVCDLDLEAIFEKTKTIDKAFLDNLLLPSLVLSVRYSDFADIRIQRIWVLSRTVYTILTNWQHAATFSDAVRNSYTGIKFKKIIAEILHLYSEETRMLSSSIRLFGTVSKSVSAYTDALYKVMEDVTDDIAELYTNKIFGDKTIYA